MWKRILYVQAWGGSKQKNNSKEVDKAIDKYSEKEENEDLNENDDDDDDNLRIKDDEKMHDFDNEEHKQNIYKSSPIRWFRQRYI